MKRIFTAIAGLLMGAWMAAVGLADDVGKTVMYNRDTYKLLEARIILSNNLAVALGDLWGTSNNTTVIRIQGKGIPAPVAGDDGKALVYNHATGAFIYSASGGSPTNWSSFLAICNVNLAGFAVTNGYIEGMSTVDLTNSATKGLLAYGWGNHSTNGYLKVETDPIFASWLGTNTYVKVETDPIFTTSVAQRIAITDTSNWTTAYDWIMTYGGTIATTNYVTNYVIQALASYASKSNDWTTAFSWGNHATNGYLKVETDPIFSTSVAQRITITDTNNWTTAFSWGNHALAGYASTTSVNNISNSWFNSVAYRIGITDTQNWTTAFNWGNHATNGYLTAGGASGFYSTSFSNANLVASNLTVAHWLSNQWNCVFVYNNASNMILPDQIFAESTTTTVIRLPSFAPITGVWYTVISK